MGLRDPVFEGRSGSRTEPLGRLQCVVILVLHTVTLRPDPPSILPSGPTADRRSHPFGVVRVECLLLRARRYRIHLKLVGGPKGTRQFTGGLFQCRRPKTLASGRVELTPETYSLALATPDVPPVDQEGDGVGSKLLDRGLTVLITQRRCGPPTQLMRGRRHPKP